MDEKNLFLYEIASDLRLKLSDKVDELVLVVEQEQYFYPKPEEEMLRKYNLLPEPTVFLKNTLKLGEMPEVPIIIQERENSKNTLKLGEIGSIKIGTSYNKHAVAIGKYWKINDGPIILPDISYLINYGRVQEGEEIMLPIDRPKPTPNKSVYVIAGDEEVRSFLEKRDFQVTLPFIEMIKKWL